MNECIIAYHIGNGSIEIVKDEHGEVYVFESRESAIEYALENELFYSGQARYQIIECDEL